MSLAQTSNVLIPIFPRVTGLKIEHLWRRGSPGAVRCTARLSRRLRADEVNRIERLANTCVERAEVVHECGPDEVEDWHTRLVDALAGAAAFAPRRAAVGERPQRGPRTPANAPRPQPDPAA